MTVRKVEAPVCVDVDAVELADEEEDKVISGFEY